jgi:UDP-3-O-[3-hydroxymyristoyl] glucosamine N-acyltransferase
VASPLENRETTSGEGVRTLTASDIAGLVGGSLNGDASAEVLALAPLDRATESDLSFLASARYAPLYARTRASTVLIAPEFAELATTAAARIVVAKPHDAMLTVLPQLYRAPKREPGVHATARLGQGVTLGSDVTIGPYAVIGDGAVIGDRSWVEANVVLGARVVVGADVHLFPAVTVYSGTTLGARVLVHSGARLGSDGFGYVFRNGIHDKIPHIGRCIIEDDVEIGANTTIDRATFGDTIVRRGTKIDNLVQIGHNVDVGEHSILVSQVGVSGSSRLGRGVVLAGQVGVADHVTIGDGTLVGAQAGVPSNLPAGGKFLGSPARPMLEAKRIMAADSRLPELLRRVRALERALESLTGRSLESERRGDE